MISSSACVVDKTSILELIDGLYSPAYLACTVDNTTLCRKCTFSNRCESKNCDICATEVDGTVKICYKDSDSDTLFTSLTSSQVMNVLKVLHTIAADYGASRFRSAYALIRPPGHHSTMNCHSGFCIINNSYILANKLARFYGKKVLVFDWDLHHGDGTEDMLVKNAC